MINNPKQDKATRKRPKIYREEIKDRHTSHWDLDMLSHAELTALMASKKNRGHSGFLKFSPGDPLRAAVQIPCWGQQNR